MSMPPIRLAGEPLSLADVEAVARQGARVDLDVATTRRLAEFRMGVDRAAMGESAIYGVNTGFGSLARHRIDPDQVREVQRNLIRSHAAGVGEPLPVEVVRAMMLILAASLARGYSGVRPVVVERLIELLNLCITPVVPSRGSVGASGDLAPLAHIALVLIGEGSTVEPVPDGVDLQPLTLEAKEGLALINGTHMMAAIGTLAVCDVARLFDASLTAASISIDACRGSDAPLDPRLHRARNQPGQIAVAARMRAILAGSQIVASHKNNDPRVQDPYCLRATPQVLGAAADTIEYCRGVIECELGAVTDNPLVFSSQPDGVDFVSGGNFHGMPLAIAMDTLAIAICHIAGIAERRVNWLLTASDSENPVNPYLSPQPGLHSGLMIVQYTAAACCNELQTLTTPASVANIPTSAGIEDYNSMGATSAHQVRLAIELATQVIAIELLVMCEALEYQRPLRSGPGVEAAHDAVRSVVPRLTADRPPAPDIAAIADLIRTGRINPSTSSRPT